MADIVANDPIVADGPAIMQELDVEEHPVRDPLFAPQQQYATDQQGTLTKWLAEDTTARAKDDELLRVMA